MATWALRYRQQFAKGSKPRRRSNDDDGPSRGTHYIVAIAPDRWRCTVCRREAWTPRVLQRLRKSACQGHIAGSCHDTHRLATTRGVLWCRRCGAYTTRQPRALRRPCAGCPTSEAARNVRARLARGLAPTTARYLGAASITEWSPYAAAGSAAAPTTTSDQSGLGSCTHIDQQLKKDALHASTPVDTSGHSGPATGGVEGGGRDGHDTNSSTDFGLTVISAVRRRIRGKSAPPQAAHASTPIALQHGVQNENGQSYGRSEDQRAHVNSSAADLASDRAARTRYRQLDLRTARAVSGGAEGLPSQSAGRNQDRDTKNSSAASDGRGTNPKMHDGYKDWCNAGPNTAWTQRIYIRNVFSPMPCAVCATPCRARCMGCGASCCIACARTRKPCIARGQATPSSRHGDEDHDDAPRRRVATARIGHQSDAVQSSLARQLSSRSSDRVRHHHHHVVGDAALEVPTVHCLSQRALSNLSDHGNDVSVDDLNVMDASGSHFPPRTGGEELATSPTTTNAVAVAAVASCSALTASEVLAVSGAAAAAACDGVGDVDVTSMASLEAG